MVEDVSEPINDRWCLETLETQFRWQGSSHIWAGQLAQLRASVGQYTALAAAAAVWNCHMHDHLKILRKALGLQPLVDLAVKAQVVNAVS